MELSQNLDYQLRMRVSPRLVATSHMLGLSSMQLHQEISAELLDNPALELIDVPMCPVCGGPLQGSICPVCLALQKGPAAGEVGADDDPADYEYERSLESAPDDDFDPLARLRTRVTLSEYLLDELRTAIRPKDVPIADYLVGSLDEKGYLRCSLEEVVELTAVPMERVRAVLAALQSIEPFGIGARNLRECLLIQLEHLEAGGAVCPPLARQVVEHYLDDLGRRKHSRIASKLHTSTAAIAEVASFIREHLNPYPTRGFGAPDARDSEDVPIRVLPDVVITRRPGTDGGRDGFEVEVVDSARSSLRLTPIYNRLAAELKREPGRFSDEEKHHIKQYVSRSKLFIANIDQRRETIRRISECVASVQADFLCDGVRSMKPLTRAAVSAKLELHESTVSRATAHKYVMLPNRNVIPFSDFFTPSLPIMEAIKDVIKEESSPLTDVGIQVKLAERGIAIARRTVAKHRGKLRLLPSTLRQVGA